MPWKPYPEFEPTTFTNDLKRLRLFYEAHGYYHLRLSYDLKTEVKGKERIVDVALHLVEGKPIRIESIDVTVDGYHPPANRAGHQARRSMMARFSIRQPTRAVSKSCGCFSSMTDTRAPSRAAARRST